MNIKCIGSKAEVEKYKKITWGIDFSHSDDMSVHYLVCSKCRQIINSSKYDPTLPGFCFEIPEECPKCGVKIRKVVEV